MTPLSPVEAAGAAMIGAAVTGFIAALLWWWWRVDPDHRFRDRLGPAGVAALLAAMAVPVAEYAFLPDDGVAVDPAFADGLRAIPLWVALPLLALFVPIAEELLFRGLVLVRLAQRWHRLRIGGRRAGDAMAAFGSTMAFGVLHLQYDWVGMAATMLLGLFLALARIRGAPLAAVIAVHAANNAVALLLNG